MGQSFDIFTASVTPFVDTRESAAFLHKAKDQFSVLNLSYWFLGTSNRLPDRMTWLSTYDQRYMEIYLKEMSPIDDPAFDIGFRRGLPLDWDEVRVSHTEINNLHEIAESFGVGRHGISFPIRDRDEGDAMFSVNFECDDDHWMEIRHHLVSELHLFAHYFHLRMRDVIAARPVLADFDLSPREREVLLWAADGKTAWETAQLLGVSERAVQLYTSNAMQKMRAKTKTQAVAIAVRNRLVS